MLINQRELPLHRSSVQALRKPDGLRVLLTGAPRLGDLLFAFPAMNHLLACGEIRALTVMCFGYAAPLLKGLEGDVDRIEINAHSWSFLNTWRLVQTINRRGFDAAIVLDEKRSMRKLLAKTKIPAVLIESSTDLRKPEQHLQSILQAFPGKEALNEPVLRCPVVKVTKDASLWAEERISDFRRPLIALHVGCRRIGRKKISFAQVNRTATKLWLVERFLELGQISIEKLKATLLMVGSGSNERMLADELRKRLGSNCVNTVDWGDSMQTAALLRQTDILVASDGGILHLGAAVGTKVVAVWGPTPVESFGPCGPPERIRIVRKEVGCRPCKKTECDDKICLSSISAAEVFSLVAELLDGSSSACCH